MAGNCCRTLNTAAAALREARPAVQIIFVVRFLVGAALAAGPADRTPTRVAEGAITWLAATVAVYLFGGATDVTEDRVNGSKRPIVTGILDARRAVHIAAALALFAVVSGALLDIHVFGLVVMFLGLGHQYSAPPLVLKKRPGAVVVVLALGGWATYAAGVAVVGGRMNVDLIVVATAMSAWMGLVGSSAKDLSDVAGDRTAGRMTISVRHGETIGGLFTATFAVTVAAGFLLTAWQIAPHELPPAAVLGVGALGVVRYALAQPAGHTRSERRRAYRAFMSAQYGANLAMLVVLVRADL